MIPVQPYLSQITFNDSNAQPAFCHCEDLHQGQPAGVGVINTRVSEQMLRLVGENNDGERRLLLRNWREIGSMHSVNSSDAVLVTLLLLSQTT